MFIFREAFLKRDLPGGLDAKKKSILRRSEGKNKNKSFRADSREPIKQCRKASVAGRG